MPAQKIRALFSKTGDMAFISHLDLIRLFQRALRRSSLPAAVTEGFSPRIKMSITKALKLGVESTSEEAIFYMRSRVSLDDFLKNINSKLPEGVKVLRTEEIV
jgi:radical SAM-linked protein